MTREEAKSCIGTIEMLQRLAYNIHGVMDVIDADNCKKIIKALAQEPRWISVIERLPEKTGWYLITFKTYGGGYAVSDMCYRKPENYWTRDDISKKVFDNDEIVAWMPLPQPYREVEE